MKHPVLSIAVLLVALSAGTQASAQKTEVITFPGTPSYTGGMSPPSTLRITETPGPQQPAVQDSAASLQEYTRCRTNSDRQAVNNEQLRAGAARCLRELEERRRQGR